MPKQMILWTDEEDAILHQWRDKKSASLISEQLLPHRTASAICGRMQRLGLARPSNTSRWADEYRPHPQKNMTAVPARRVSAAPLKPPKAKKQQPEEISPDAVWQPLDGKRPVILIELEQHHCRWPVTGGSCGANNSGDGTYCVTHRAIAIRGGTTVW
jgi:hypothetical protein